MIPAGVRIFVCTEPVDMRYGFDRLARVARERVGQDPVEGGALSVFAGKSAARLKVLWFDLVESERNRVSRRPLELA